MAHNMGFWYQQGVCLLEVFVYLCLSIHKVHVDFLCMCICILLLVYPQGVCGFLMHVYLGLSLKHNMKGFWTYVFVSPRGLRCMWVAPQVLIARTSVAPLTTRCTLFISTRADLRTVRLF